MSEDTLVIRIKLGQLHAPSPVLASNVTIFAGRLGGEVESAHVEHTAPAVTVLERFGAWMFGRAALLTDTERVL